MLDFSEDELRQRLQDLKQEHADLDQSIGRITETPPYDELMVMRMKRRKLQLKDEIARIRNMITPDIIA